MFALLEIDAEPLTSNDATRKLFALTVLDLDAEAMGRVLVEVELATRTLARIIGPKEFAAAELEGFVRHSAVCGAIMRRVSR
jgi:hypothetical protein